MNTSNKPISDKKRYVLRLLDLAKKDPQIGALMPIESVRNTACDTKLSLDKVMTTFLDGYAERSALAQRTYEITSKNTRHYLPSYTAITYKVLHERIKAVAMSWRTHPKCQVHRDEFVCIMGFASIDFAVIDMACAYAKAITVPVASSTAGADLGEIFSNVEPVVLATTIADLDLSVKHAIQQKSIKSLLVFNYDKRIEQERLALENAQKELQETNTSLVLLNELIEYGQQKSFSFLPQEENENEKLAVIIHSSGSTGKPKGACISAKALIDTWQGKPRALPRITVLMAPFNHFMGRGDLYGALNIGGTAYFTLMPDMSTLFEDIRLARPTGLGFFPRIFELIHQHFQNEVTRRLRSKEDNRTVIEAAVKAEMKSTYLGDRLLLGTVGSAPTSAKVKKFIVDCFDILLIEGYGNTEAGSGSLTLDDKINRKTVIDYKLKDVPELGYYTTDKPYPRGELCVKTRFGIKQYYKQPKATAGLLDEEGYNLTGDIVEEQAPDKVVIIDRRKDVLKLSQGEYVAVGPLGKVFEGGSAVIHQIYVYGNSHRSYLLAVVVPEMEVAQKLLGDGMTENKLKNLIRAELQKVGQKEGLKSFEIPRDFIIEKEKFTRSNELLSAVRKYLRPAIKRKYGGALEAMYEAHDQIQIAESEALKDPNSTLTTEEKLIKLLESNLGYKGFETTEPRTFNQLGGDSLGAALFSMSIEEVFDVSIGADVILSPKGNIKHWAKLIESAQNDDSNRPTFLSIHGKGTKIVHLIDLQLEKFIDKDILDNVPNLKTASQQPKTVLFTGANGFLGHIVCLKWLEKLAQTGGKLICIIRAADNAAAKVRLDKKFQGIDTIFETRYNELAAQHLEVITGDISEPLLGLEEKTYNRLTKTVDRICHIAALVNHRLAYQHLFGPNVVGTTEIIRLAITHQKKAIDFISTVGVQSLLDKSNGNNEAAPLKSSIKLSNHYASGYATSKWAGERLLQQASQELGLTTNILRCDMIMPDQIYKGQINTEDIVTRLLYSIITTGLAPTSFYQLNPNDAKSNAHYDGVPVDVLADAIVGLSLDNKNQCSTFNAQNYLEDDISLDSFVDWIETAGYDIHRIKEHKTWYERMENKLKSLSEAQRKHSMIDIMGAYGRPYPVNANSPDCSNFKALVQQLNNGQDIPPLSETYIHKYLNDMVILGLIDKAVLVV